MYKVLHEDLSTGPFGGVYLTLIRVIEAHLSGLRFTIKVFLLSLEDDPFSDFRSFPCVLE